MSLRLLPLINATGPHGSRSAMTCKYRCGNACDHPEPNTSGNEHIHDVLRTAVARRALLKGAMGAATGAALGGMVASPAAAATGLRGGKADRFGAMTFEPVSPNRRDNVVVPPGYDYDIVARWGDRVTARAPQFDVYDQSPSAQAEQFGYNCDYVGVLPMAGTSDRALLVVNHEYTDEYLMFPTNSMTSAKIKRTAMQAHGMSVVEIVRRGAAGSWRRVRPERTTHNRRITATSPMELTGPAAGDDRLKTSADRTGTRVLGTLNNCAGGTTPWGTVLSGEENFNQYFDKSGDLDSRYTASYARYGITGTDSRGWSEVDDRFDLSTEPHEPFRFGWIVELDPYDPTSTPRKRTMLGRMKHEGADISISEDGRVVAYMGDDERGDYIYKFVSSGRFWTGSGARAKRHNLRLLDSGTLYVAKFDGDGTKDGQYDGTGVWIPLTSHSQSFVYGMSVNDVLINTRLAADAVKPTRMDRPEDIQRNPVNGRIYCALTNNSSRGTTYPTNEANPLAESQVRDDLNAPLRPASGNRNGYVLEITENGSDAAASAFRWLLFLVCGDPEAPETYFGGYPKDRVSPISSPDNVEFDREGNLWISTDGNALGSNDGMFAVPTQGVNRGQVLQFLTVPIGAECSGPLISADQLTLFNAVQHPGETDDATFENPSSTWPHTERFPRPSVIATYRTDNQRIGR